MKKSGLLILILFASLSLLTPQTLFAVGSAGIENASFSGRQIAQSGAGTAQADEPAAISYNPAGITQLDGLQIEPTMHFIDIFTFFESDEPLSGGKGSNTRSSGTVLPVPTGYITFKPKNWFDNRITFGVGSDSPFGFSNKFNSTHPIAQLSGFKNWFKMYTVKPTVAVKLADWLSIGGGPMYYRIYDWGGIQAYPNILSAGAPFGTLKTDLGQVRLNLSGNHWGWHFGVLATPHKQHQFGFYFRSPVVVKTSGIIKVTNSSRGYFETGGNAKWSLPMNLTWAYAFKPTERATIEFDFGYTRWSSFERLFINADPVSPAEDNILSLIGKNNKDWKDSYNLQLGGNYKLTNRLTIRGGGYFYTNSVPEVSFISAVPDGNRLAYSLGASYEVNKNFGVDAAYLNVWNLRRTVNNNIGNGLGVSQDGDYVTYTQEATVSCRFAFDDPIADLVSTTSNPSPVSQELPLTL